MSEARSEAMPHVSLTDILQRAIKKQRAGDTRGARERYCRVLEASPRNYEALTLLGELERKAGNYQAATGYFRAASRIQPRRADVMDSLGKALTGGGESRAAMRAYLRAIEVDPEYAPTYVSLGRAFVDAGRAEDGKRCFTEACRLDPSLAASHFGLADCLFDDDDLAAARASYLRGIELDPDAVTPRLRLAWIYEEQGRHGQARKHYRESLRRCPTSLDGHIGLARSLIEDYRLDEALASCQKALQIESRSAAAMVQLGRLHLRRMEVASARQSFTNAIAVEPESADAHTGNATALELDGRYGEALAIMRRVIHKEEAGFESETLLARLLRHHGESGEALQRLRIRIDSLSPTAARARRELELETARIHEENGDYDKALLHYATAAEASERHFDVDECRNEVERIVSFFDPSTFARLSRAQAGVATPVIIVGLPSSGVRMVRNAISAHDRMVSAGPQMSLARVARKLASHVGSGRRYPASALDARSADLQNIADTSWSGGRSAAYGQCFVVDASWSCDLHLGLAELLFPNARVIHCVRDARDAALACYFRDYDGPECAFGANLPDIVARIHMHNDLMRHWRGTGDLRFLTVSREAMASEPQEELNRVLAFLDMPFQLECLSRAATFRGHVASPGFYTPTLDSSIGRHNNYANTLGAGLDGALASVTNERGWRS